MLDKLDAALRFGQEALNLRAQRQEIWPPTSPTQTHRVIRRGISISPAN